MYENGNLLLTYNNPNRFLWESNTAGRGERLVMEVDGNLVIYDNNDKKVWETNTAGRGEYMQVEDDANFVVHDSGESEAWSTGNNLSKQSNKFFN